MVCSANCLPAARATMARAILSNPNNACPPLEKDVECPTFGLPACDNVDSYSFQATLVLFNLTAATYTSQSSLIALEAIAAFLGVDSSRVVVSSTNFRTSRRSAFPGMVLNFTRFPTLSEASRNIVYLTENFFYLGSLQRGNTSLQKLTTYRMTDFTAVHLDPPESLNAASSGSTSSSSTSTLLIAVVAGVVGFLLLLAIILCYCKNKKDEKSLEAKLADADIDDDIFEEMIEKQKSRASMRDVARSSMAFTPKSNKVSPMPSSTEPREPRVSRANFAIHEVATPHRSTLSSLARVAISLPKLPSYEGAAASSLARARLPSISRRESEAASGRESTVDFDDQVQPTHNFSAATKQDAKFKKEPTWDLSNRKQSLDFNESDEEDDDDTYRQSSRAQPKPGNDVDQIMTRGVAADLRFANERLRQQQQLSSKLAGGNSAQKGSDSSAHSNLLISGNTREQKQEAEFLRQRLQFELELAKKGKGAGRTTSNV